MILKKAFILMPFILAYSATASADETWTRLLTNKDTTYYVNVSSIKKTKNSRIAWLRSDRNFKTGNINAVTAKIIFFCNQNKYITEYSVSYDDDGNKVNSGYENLSSEVVPGTVGEDIYKYVCTYPL